MEITEAQYQVILKHFANDKFADAMIDSVKVYRDMVGRRVFENKRGQSFHDEAARCLLIRGACDGLNEIIVELQRMKESALSNDQVQPGQA